MAINPAFSMTVSYKDRSNEPTSWSVPVPFTRFALGTADPLYTALIDAANGLINGNPNRVNWTKTAVASSEITGTEGQREQKYLITYEDLTTFARYSFELPLRDPVLLPPVKTDEYPLDVAPYSDFVSALEAYAVSPDGNLINVVSIRLMGKNT